MARPIRLDVEGGWYHVLNRGIERKVIFRDPQYYSHFIELLSRLPGRFGVRVHGYVLLANHYHLQIETPRANLSKAIQWLNVAYSVWHNRKCRRVGPLFQGRFKAILHEASSEALIINRYIHLNPARVRRLGGHEGRSELEPLERTSELGRARVMALRKYLWSSYPSYAGSIKKPEWLTTESILGFIGEGSLRRLTDQYRSELEEAAGLGEWRTDWKERVRAGVLLGSQEFLERMSGLLKGDRREQTGLRHNRSGRLAWEQITEAVSKVWGQEWAAVATGYGNGARAAALYVARYYSDWTLRELGQLVGEMEYPAVTMAIRRLEKRWKVDEELGRKMKQLLRLLQVKA